MKRKDSNKKSVALFGGSFDPVHNGHVDIIKHLGEVFDEVVVMPTKQSPFKADKKTASAADRLNMLKLAGITAPNVVVSDMEICGEGVSYTYLTVQKLQSTDKKISVVIGSEMIKELYKWEKLDELKSNAEFYILNRPGFNISKTDLKKYGDVGLKITLSDYVGKDISSSEIKAAVVFNREQDFLPASVCSYIYEKRLYKDYSYITKRYKEFCMDDDRIAHTYRAVKEGIMLAKIHNQDVEKAVIALLLHDIAKNLTEDDLRQKFGIECYLPDGLPESCKHAPMGAEMAKTLFGIKDSQILEAIAFHTTGNPAMDSLSKVVAIADYTEEGRRYKGLKPMRKMAKKDLDRCMEMVLGNTLKRLKSQEIYSASKDTYNFLRKRRKGNGR